MNNNDRDLKLVLVGGPGVGKTCCVRMATTGFYDNNSKPTLGASFTAKMVHFQGKDYRLQIWDTAGQERYRSMAPMYFRGSQGALIMYSIIDKESFEMIDEWVEQLRDSKGIKLFLVGNKIDCQDDRVISTKEGEDKAAQIGAMFAEVSAKTGDGINDLFDEIPIQILTAKCNETEITSAKFKEKSKDAKGNCC